MLVRNDWHPSLDWTKALGQRTRTPAYSTPLGALFQEDAREVLSRLPTDSVDLVMTSPPFALTRQKEYGNEPVKRYLEWFLPFTREIYRVLKPTGSFVLDIGGAWLPGTPVRSTYHFEVAIKLVHDGFRLAQDFYWYNPSRLPSPAEWVTVRRSRVKDAVNTVWWLSKSDHPKADNRRVLKPYGENADTHFRDDVPRLPCNLLEIATSESLRHISKPAESGASGPTRPDTPNSWSAFSSTF